MSPRQNEAENAARILEIAAEAKQAPSWLRVIVERIGASADSIEPLPDNRAELPEFVYRH